MGIRFSQITLTLLISVSFMRNAGLATSGVNESSDDGLITCNSSISSQRSYSASQEVHKFTIAEAFNRERDHCLRKIIPTMKTFGSLSQLREHPWEELPNQTNLPTVQSFKDSLDPNYSPKAKEFLQTALGTYEVMCYINLYSKDMLELNGRSIESYIASQIAEYLPHCKSKHEIDTATIRDIQSKIEDSYLALDLLEEPVTPQPQIIFTVDDVIAHAQINPENYSMSFLISIQGRDQIASIIRHYNQGLLSISMWQDDTNCGFNKSLIAWMVSAREMEVENMQKKVHCVSNLLSIPGHPDHFNLKNPTFLYDPETSYETDTITFRSNEIVEYAETHQLADRKYLSSHEATKIIDQLIKMHNLSMINISSEGISRGWYTDVQFSEMGKEGIIADMVIRHFQTIDHGHSSQP